MHSEFLEGVRFVGICILTDFSDSTGVKVAGSGENEKVPFLLHAKACHLLGHVSDHFPFMHGCSVC